MLLNFPQLKQQLGLCFKMRNRRRTLFKFTVVALLIIFGILLFLEKEDDIDNRTKIMLIERSIRSPLNNGECRHPYLPINNPEVMKFYETVEKINCGKSWEDWVMCEKSICFVKPEVIASYGEAICSYTDLIRKTDYRVKYGKTTKTKEPYVLQESDFVRVSCSTDRGHSWYGLAYGIRDTVQRNIPLKLTAFAGGIGAGVGTNDELSPPYFNVLIYGFDSLSRNAFMRKLPKTYAYLTQQLQAIVLKGYNIVGDGTPQALVPLLTGYTELELPETRKRMRNAYNVNVYPMIWKEYAQHGYVTSFNEDMPNTGTFTYRMTGFAEQPTDHYLHTYYLEAQNILSSSKKFCISHQVEHNVMLDYTKNIMAKYSDAPKFIFSFHGALSHDSINLIGAADDDVAEWLHTIKEKHLLDNTILIFMSDHGNRFSTVRATLQGKQEERLPFFSFAFPESFKKRYPQQYANFVGNAELLTTPFDVHATLKDILKIQIADAQQKTAQLAAYEDAAANRINDFATDAADSTSPIAHISELASERSISLFERIPHNRSCADAYIEPHWCACLNWQPVSGSDIATNGTLLKLGANIVATINNATERYRNLCAPLTLQNINWAMRLLPHKEMLQYKRASDRDGYVADLSDKTRLHEAVYQLQIVVEPGESLFEASVTYDLQTLDVKTKLSEISRVNKYGTQANCIYERDPELRKYCYCRTQ